MIGTKEIHPWQHVQRYCIESINSDAKFLHIITWIELIITVKLSLSSRHFLHQFEVVNIFITFLLPFASIHSTEQLIYSCWYETDTTGQWNSSHLISLDIEGDEVVSPLVVVAMRAWKSPLVSFGSKLEIKTSQIFSWHIYPLTTILQAHIYILQFYGTTDSFKQYVNTPGVDYAEKLGNWVHCMSIFIFLFCFWSVLHMVILLYNDYWHGFWVRSWWPKVLWQAVTLWLVNRKIAVRQSRSVSWWISGEDHVTWEPRSQI